MFGLIRYTAKLVFFAATYLTIIAYLGDLATEVSGAFTTTPLLTMTINVLYASVSTLSWIFSPHLIMFASMVWLMLPMVKFGFYITKKFM